MDQVLGSPAAGRFRDADRSGLAVGLSRAELFAGLSVLGFANGALMRAQSAVTTDGLAAALFDTFDISAIVWVAFCACPALMLRAPREPPSRGDLVVAACAAGAFLLPISPLSWVALTTLALYLLQDRVAPRFARPPLSDLQRGAWVLLTTTGAMFWGRVLLATAGGPVLRADAVLVGWLVRTPNAGNTVQFADGTGHIWIGPPCSSLANLSLALLCWVLFTQWRGCRWSVRNVGWCLLACLAVVGINVTRMSLIVLHPEQYELIHGAVGTTLASWLTVIVTVGVCAYGTRRHRDGAAHG